MKTIVRLGLVAMAAGLIMFAFDMSLVKSLAAVVGMWCMAAAEVHAALESERERGT